MRRADSNRSRPRTRVVWDEANLEYLDSNKSPKQKITEPKTPYHVPAQEDGSISPIAGDGRKFLDQAAQAEQIQHALMEVASTSNSQRRSRGGWTSSEDEADDMDQETEDVEMSNRDKSFQEQRKAHYDEYRKLKALRQSIAHRVEEESQPMEKEDTVSQADGLGIKNPNGTISSSALVLAQLKFVLTKNSIEWVAYWVDEASLILNGNQMWINNSLHNQKVCSMHSDMVKKDQRKEASTKYI
ncbi:hypothetical protein GOP47_0012865 [Adiantum capillus-veneris]|uniref:Protein phosphatase inhibitor 2 n=1 Tax=Adiantum capillus-veneris TaxID=13818 RepID=A0A9D4ZET4_ADICA|nr:hypothetical protein GOP47_0012865 [Adiantum capillus-veneris]